MAQPIDEYDGIDAISPQHLAMENQDLYLLTLGAAHHFIEHDDEELVIRFTNLLKDLAPYMTNITKVKLYEYIFENVRNGKPVPALDQWEEVLDLLDDCPVIQDRIKS